MFKWPFSVFVRDWAFAHSSFDKIHLAYTFAQLNFSCILRVDQLMNGGPTSETTHTFRPVGSAVRNVYRTDPQNKQINSNTTATKPPSHLHRAATPAIEYTFWDFDLRPAMRRLWSGLGALDLGNLSLDWPQGVSLMRVRSKFLACPFWRWRRRRRRNEGKILFGSRCGAIVAFLTGGKCLRWNVMGKYIS